MRSFTVEERRVRLGRRHGLIEPLPDMASVVHAVLVLHATDPATVYLSALARLEDPSLDTVAAALYDDRTIARILAMRRTLFVVAVDDLAMVERSSTDGVAANERKRLEGFLTDSGIDDPAAWLTAAAEEVETALVDGGLPARTVTATVPRLATKIVMGAGTKHAATAGATSRTIALLANEGLLMRGRPGGQWTGRQYTWHLREQWLGPSPPAEGEMTRDQASSELVQRWLERFGPATIADVKWWSGWTMGQVKKAIATIDITDVELDCGDNVQTGIVLTDDLDDGAPEDAPECSGEPWVAVLPSLDPTAMGWKERDWYLGEHKAELFDNNGNVGPTIWADGRIVGGWAQRPDGEIVTAFLEDVGTDHGGMIEAEVRRIQSAIGDTVVKPSFPTPLQKRLAT